MSSTTKKHRDFVSEPIGEKDVSSIPGIGAVLAKRLGEKGFPKAYNLLGQVLLLNKDKAVFMEWLTECCQANSKQSQECATALCEWAGAHI